MYIYIYTFTHVSLSTVFQEGAINFGMLLEKYWKDTLRRSLHVRIALGKLLERSSQHTDEMEVQSKPKSIKMIQKPTPGGVPHRLGGALKGSWALLGGS